MSVIRQKKVTGYSLSGQLRPMATGGKNLSGFPELQVNPEDISGSYPAWLDQFEPPVALKALELGEMEQANAQGEKVKVRKLLEKAKKTLALLKCIGSEHSHILTSKGLTDLAGSDGTMYKRALDFR